MQENASNKQKREKTFITFTNMKAEEKDLERRFGKQQPFRVPDGYFDNLAANIMDKIPEELPAMTPRVSLWRRLRPAVAVAASVCAVMFSVLLFMDKPKEARPTLVHNTSVKNSSTDSYTTLDVAADYTMLDNDDIYAMVSENQ